MFSQNSIITSVTNKSIVHCCKLKKKKYRDEFKQYIIEGEKMVREAIQLGIEPVEIYTLQEYDFIKDFKYNVVTENVMKKISDTVSPQGIIGVFEIKDTPLCDFYRCVVLDNIQDAGNLGTIIRTMSATGIDVLILDNCVDVYNPKTIRSSMSGIHYVKYYDMNGALAIKTLKDRKIPIFTADMSGEDVFKMDNPKSFALVIGNEGHGLSNEYIENCDKTISLKMKNIESLNAGVATSILLYKFTN